MKQSTENISLDKVLGRADMVVLSKLLGPHVVKLLGSLDASMSSTEKLRSILTTLRPPQELLQIEEVRAEIFQLLKPNEAQLAVTALGLDPCGDPWATLTKATYANNSKRLQALASFLHVRLSPPNLASDKRPSRETIRPESELFQHQRDAVREVLVRLKRDPHRVILHMPTGSGKTRTAMHIISRHLMANTDTLAVWLAYSEELCEQAANEFARVWKHTADESAELLRFWGAHDLSISDIQQCGTGILIAGLGKMFAAIRKDISIAANIGDRASIIIMDEAHQAIAPTYAMVIDAIQARKAHTGTGLLGLTATPGRTWDDIDEDERLAKFFSRQRVVLNIPGYDSPVRYLEDMGYLAKAEYEPLQYKNGKALTEAELQKLQKELDVPRTILDSLGRDEQRNLLIVQKIEDLAKTHRRILVFAASVENAEILSAVLSTRGTWAKCVSANTPSTERASVISKFRERSSETRVLCNFGVLTTGFDAPNTSAIIIARPTRSLVLYSQMVGRGIRGPKAGGNPQALIVTVVDLNLPGFGSVIDAFHNWEDVWKTN